MLMCANNRAVDEHFLKVRVLRQLRKDLMPDTTTRPAGKALIDAVPRPKFTRKVAPGAPRAGNPQHGFDKQPIVGGGAPWIAELARQKRRYPLKLIILQPHTYHPDAAQKSGYDHKSPED